MSFHLLSRHWEENSEQSKIPADMELPVWDWWLKIAKMKLFPEMCMYLSDGDYVDSLFEDVFI